LYLTASHLVTRLLGLAATMVLTRYLGPAEYGDLTLAYAYWGLFGTLVEAGLDLTLIREASQNPERLGHLVGNGILLRGALAATGYFLATAALPVLGYGPATVRLLRLATLMLALSPFAVARLIFIVTLRIKLVAVLDGIGQLVNTALVLAVALFQSGRGEQVLLAQIAATAAAHGLYLAYGRRLLPGPIAFRVDWRLWGSLLGRAWPLTVTGALSTLQLHASRLIVGHVLSSADGGAYSAAMKLVTGLNFLPALYCTAVYPLLSQHHKADPERFRRLYRLSFRVMMVAILPIALLASLTSREIVTLYAGRVYLPAAPLLAILAWAQVLQFAGPILYYVILAAGQQRVFPPAAAVRALVHVGLYALLLSRLGLVGAAVATLISSAVVLGLYGALSTTRAYMLDWLRASLRPLAATLILGALLILVHPPAIVTWLAGPAVYGLLMCLSRSFDRDDIQLIHRVFGHSRLK
jgi:O-antigen/teichoic acid export membrane protein